MKKETTEPNITIRELFAKDAPNEVPHWFESRHEAAPKRPLIPKNLREEQKKELQSWLRDPCWYLQDDLKFFQDAHYKYNEDKRKWDLKTEEERYFQWRIYFADQLINLLNRTK